MSRTLILINTLLWGFTMSLTAQFTDDFSDGDFTQNPEWTGDTGLFIVDGQSRLRLDDSVSNEAVLVTKSRAILNATWEFYVKMDFDPSGSNFCRVYLMSDLPDFKGALNGYHVRIGGFSGNVDHVSLYRQTGTNSSQIIKGTDGTVASSPELYVRVTRDSAGLWELEIDTGLAGNFVSQGSALDDQHLSAEYFGVRCTYTSTRSDLIFFDDFNVTGNVIPDTVPPRIDSARTLSSTSVELFFNEDLDPATATSPANYSVDNGVGNPVNVTQSGGDPSKVNLLFNPPLPDMTRYTVTVNSVEDLDGNPVQGETAQFVRFTPQQPDVKDVLINEIMADENPSAGLPLAEYVELHNISNKAFQLRNWTFHDNSNSAAMPSYALLPGEYVVLLDESHLSLYNELPNKIGLPGMPVLRNSDDDISIRTPQGVVIDSVSYTDSWYRDSDKSGGGYSLELINPKDPCSNANNWIASNAPLGGTPGEVNSVYDTTPDTEAPFIIGFEITAHDELLLGFNKTIDQNSATIGNFSITPAAGISSVALSGTYRSNVLISFDDPLDSARVYEVAVSGVQDCWGNVTPGETVRFAAGLNPEPHEIIFNEIHHNPDDEIGMLPNEKFTEFFNVTDKPLRLGDLMYSDRTSSRQFPNTVIFPREYIIVTRTAFEQDYAQYGRVIAFSSGPSPNVNDDDLMLIRSDGREIDRLSYARNLHSDEAFGGGVSLERINPHDFCAGRLNWISSEHERGGTPGAPNSAIDEERTIDSPEITGVEVSALDELVVRFNRNMDLVSLKTADYRILPDVEITRVDTSEEFPAQTVLSLGSDLETGTVYKLNVENAFDCAGEPFSGSMEFIVPEPRTILINEVLFNARTGGSRFIEFYNPNPYPVAITNWRFDYTNTAGNPASRIIGGNYTIGAEGYLALTDDVQNIMEEYPNAAEENLRFQEMPVMRNSDGRVIIVSTLNDTIDDFSYDESYHFELLRDLSGVSLERISHERPSNDASNWHSASQTVNFATPGYENSQRARLQTEEDNIVLDPETFSPDNDGYNDVLNIGYELSEPGYVANIKIYDSQGRLIRNLAQNKLLDRKGAVTWNGVNDNGEKASIGIHVIHVELFDLGGSVKHFKKACVVAGKL